MVTSSNPPRDSWHGEHTIETSAAPEAIWRVLRDVAGWPRWNAGIARIELEGPFATGTWFAMQPPGQDTLRSRLLDVRENEGFTDETRIDDLVVTVAHRIERLAGGARVTYAIDAVGPGASEVGPAVSADFPEVLAALVAAAGDARS